ncbi:MAG: SUMF1/EgtB/PvdO family nonheme iron enzyme [Anaerolineae bacterium]|nr:SUMF1/EgtB/PvdO family nonheme iron enzyme [Anaerolineae bacterium]
MRPAVPADPSQQAIERARSFGGQLNRDWQPFLLTFSEAHLNDIPFCLVPVGSFSMGDDQGTAAEKPAHHQTMRQPFWIAQHPVTNAQWRRGVQAGVVPEPLDISGSLAWYHEPSLADAPVVGVTWAQAWDYAAWLGCRLPNEREWEYAARGVESWLYPWGNEWDAARPVWFGSGQGTPPPVTDYPGDTSWVGARHLIGNVKEWTASLYGAYPCPDDGSREIKGGHTAAVLRGSSFISSLNGLRATLRGVGWIPNYANLDIGLRLARSLALT